MKTQTPTKRTAHRLAAVLAIAFAFATTGAWAATNVDWGGGSGGTEASPLDVYDLSNWSGVSALSDAYDLTFDVGNVPTVLTNSCAAAALWAANDAVSAATTARDQEARERAEERAVGSTPELRKAVATLLIKAAKRVNAVYEIDPENEKAAFS